MPARSSIFMALVCLLLLPAVCSAAAPAPASSVESATTTISPSKGFRALLAREGVKLVGAGAAKNGKGTIELPGLEGVLEPTYGSGSVSLEGTLRFQAGSRKILLRKLVLNTAKKRLTATLGGKTIAIAKLERTSATQTTFGVDVKIGALRLTEKAARLLGQRLGLDGPLGAGRSLGRGTLGAELQAVRTGPGTFEFRFDEGFRQKLVALGIAATNFENGTQASALPLAFSWAMESATINRGLTYGGAGAGEGGVAFVQGEGAGTTTVRLWHLGVDFESNTSAAFWEARGPNGSFLSIYGSAFGQLDARGATRVDEAANTVSMAPTAATLAPGAAMTLNEAFAAGKATQFVAGETLGSFSFSAALR